MGADFGLAYSPSDFFVVGKKAAIAPYGATAQKPRFLQRPGGARSGLCDWPIRGAGFCPGLVRLVSPHPEVHTVGGRDCKPS